MGMRWRPSRRVALGSMGVAAALGLASGVAFASGGGGGSASGAGDAAVAAAPAAASHTSAAGTATRRPLGRLLRGAHGTFTVKDKAGTYVTRVYQRGVVSGAAPDRLVVRSADGASWVWSLGAKTVVRGGPQGTAKTVTVGENVLVVGVRAGDANGANRVIDRSAIKRRPARPSATPATPSAAAG